MRDRGEMVKKVFLCGIAGTGMSALAGLFKEAGYAGVRVGQPLLSAGGPAARRARGHPVPGLCRREHPRRRRFLRHRQRHQPRQPRGRSSSSTGAWSIFPWPRPCRGFSSRASAPLVVAGSHGKTTTASFVAHLLTVAGLRPGFFIGGKPANFAANYRLAAGDLFCQRRRRIRNGVLRPLGQVLQVPSRPAADHRPGARPHRFLPHARNPTCRVSATWSTRSRAAGGSSSTATTKWPAGPSSRAFTPVISYGRRRSGPRDHGPAAGRRRLRFHPGGQRSPAGDSIRPWPAPTMSGT